MVKRVNKTGTAIFSAKYYAAAIERAKTLAAAHGVPAYIWSSTDKKLIGTYYVTRGDEERPDSVRQVAIASVNGRLYERPE